VREEFRGGAAAGQGAAAVPRRGGVPEAGVRDAVEKQRALAEGEVHSAGEGAVAAVHQSPSGGGQESARRVRAGRMRNQMQTAAFTDKNGLDPNSFPGA
jgi:hypothetical protein